MHGRGMHGRGVFMAGGIHGRGVFMTGACLAGGIHGRGCAWQGLCMAGAVHGREGACVAGETGTAADTRTLFECILVWPKFVENFMKLKKIGPRGEARLQNFTM